MACLATSRARPVLNWTWVGLHTGLAGHGLRTPWTGLGWQGLGWECAELGWRCAGLDMGWPERILCWQWAGLSMA
jgi:hypothetical protein